MRKILLGTSALAAVALTAGAASAEAPTVTFDGAVTYEYIFYDNDNRTHATGKVDGSGHAITANEQQSELHWTAKGTADNGLEYTGRLDWRVLSGGTGAIDESWIKLGGGWGDLVIGADDGAEGNMPDALSIAGDIWMTDCNNLARHINNLDLSTSLYYFTPTGGTSDNNKVAYYTPDFNGFSFAASFTPSSKTAFQEAPETGGNNNVGEISAKYAGDFGGVGLTLAGSYIAGSADTDANEDIRSYHLGGLLSVGDFGFGLGYIDSDDSGTVKANTNDEGLSGYNAAVSYDLGSLYLNAYYQHTESRTGGNTNDNEFDLVGVAATYTIADGLKTYASFTNSELDSGAGTGSAFENEANVLIIGTSVSF